MPATVHLRELTTDDLDAAWELSRFAFGGNPERPASTSVVVPGMTRHGAFDDAGRLVGKAVDLHHDQWWSGRAVPAADVAGVAVAPEARGRGVARALLTALLAGAHERGAAVSALYPTIAAPYRSCGWEAAGVLRTVNLATAALPRHRPATHLSVRAGTPADLAAVAGLYERVTRHRNGMLTRQGKLFDHFNATGELPGDGVTLVEADGDLVGYATWQRGRGYGADSVLTVDEALAVTADAARELVGVLGSWASVAPTLRLCPLDGDAVSAHLPLEAARDHERDLWMHRPVDVARAVSARGWPAHVRGAVDFHLTDPLADWNTGAWRLAVADGAAELTRIDAEADLRLDVRGFALLYAGAAHARSVAQAGLLHHPGGVDPAALDLLGAGGPAQLLDYF
ncbi:enhanced intracellular survival protein Eis [Micromonospora sp. MH99]|uniref:GNAT family N-acetyltransferase n=1 Tax=Micromonospora sp. MH99 TaxID=1945510 RepID=UPI001F3CDB8B|nr:GNAT family N-acetyltransferase [Micromonospora sp. MH99]MCF0094865.1 Enhanced intracellular survival protein [Micromonospora sp. MH99]